MLLRRWATHQLRSGDLRALDELARHAEKPNDHCIERLSQRRFISVGPDGEISLTLRGRLALKVRRSMHS
jgi:hypothetical protein